MTSETKTRIKLPTWAGTLLAAVALAATFIGGYIDNRVENAELKVRVETLERAHTDDSNVALRLSKLEIGVSLIGAAMKIPGFPDFSGND